MNCVALRPETIVCGGSEYLDPHIRDLPLRHRLSVRGGGLGEVAGVGAEAFEHLGEWGVDADRGGHFGLCTCEAGVDERGGVPTGDRTWCGPDAGGSGV